MENYRIQKGKNRKETRKVLYNRAVKEAERQVKTAQHCIGLTVEIRRKLKLIKELINDVGEKAAAQLIAADIMKIIDKAGY